MGSLAEAPVTENILKSLYLQRLPHNARSILTTSNGNLDNIANMTDRTNVDHPRSMCILAEGENMKIKMLKNQV